MIVEKKIKETLSTVFIRTVPKGLRVTPDKLLERKEKQQFLQSRKLIHYQ